MAVFQGPHGRDEDDSGRAGGGAPEVRPAAAGVTWADFVRFVRRNRGRIVGLVIGLTVGFGVKWLGLLWTLFISLCAAVGYFVGLRLDENQEGLLEFLDRVLPPGRG